jgi:hypothetical protein
VAGKAFARRELARTAPPGFSPLPFLGFVRVIACISHNIFYLVLFKKGK